MNSYKSLLKLYFLQYFALRVSPQQKKAMYALYAVMGLLAAGVIAVLCWLMYASVQAVFALESYLEHSLIENIISFIFMQGVTLIIIFGTMAFVSVMFGSRDTELLLSLPIKTPSIFAAKMTVVYFMELIFAVAVYIPMLITVAVAAASMGVYFGAAYYILMPLSVLLMPLIPLLVIALISFPLSYIAAFFKKRAGLGGIIALALFAGLMGAYFYFVAGSSGGEGGAEFSVEDIIPLLEAQGWLFPPGLFFARAMVGSGSFAFNFGIYLVIVIGLGGAAFALAALMFRRVLRSQLETTKSAVAVANVTYKREGSLLALIKRDFKEISRDTYMTFQMFAIVILMPLMVALMGGFMQFAGTEDVPAHFGAVLQIGTISLMANMLLAASNMSAVTAFSREGKNFYMLKLLPVSSAHIILSKLRFSDVVVIIPSIISGIAFGIVNGSVFDAVAFSILLCVMGISFNGYHVYRDLKDPSLNWISFREIVRGNKRVLTGMAFGFLMAFAVFIVAMISALFAPSALTARLITYGVWLAVAVAAFLLWRFNLIKNSHGLLEQVEP